MTTARIRRITDYLSYLDRPLLLTLNTSRVQARGVLDDKTGRVLVLQDSQMQDNVTPSMRPGVGRLRAHLIERGTVANGVFTEGWIAINPSEASNVILGSRTTGLVEWRVEGPGITLREYLEKLKEYKDKKDAPDKIWVEGHWRDLPADLKDLAHPDTISEYFFMSAYAAVCSANDPHIGIRVSLERKSAG